MAQSRTKELYCAENKYTVTVILLWDNRLNHICIVLALITLKDLNSRGLLVRKIFSGMCLCCHVFSVMLLKKGKGMKLGETCENPKALKMFY